MCYALVDSGGRILILKPIQAESGMATSLTIAPACVCRCIAGRSVSKL